MSGGSRALPDRPSLRYLKLEAKRRLAAGEFATLNDAQTAIAREYGQPTWAGLKQACQEESHALNHVRWVITRFSQAGQPGWTAPGEDELREHFDDRLLAVVPPAKLAEAIAADAADLRAELVVIGQPFPRRSPPSRRWPGSGPPAPTWCAWAPGGRRCCLRRWPARPSPRGPSPPRTGFASASAGSSPPMAPLPCTAGGGLEAVAVMRSRVRDLRTHVILTSRAITVESVDDRLRRSWLNT